MASVPDLRGRRHAAHCPTHRRSPVEVFSLPIDPLTTEETLEAVEGLIRCGAPHQHVVLNAAKVVTIQDEPWLGDVVRHCDIVNADGMAVVWAARLLGRPIPERVAGVDLMVEILRVGAQRGWSIYFLGAQPSVVEAVVQRAHQEFPALKVAGYRDGYWGPAEEPEIVRHIAQASPDVLLVAMPSPRKETFLSAHLNNLKTPFVMGVGGSFDVYAGHIPRAPKWMQRAGLEWVHRLLREPRRMARRYLVGNTRFVLLVFRHWTRR